MFSNDNLESQPLSLAPINFFQLSLDCYSLPAPPFALTAKNYKKHLLPDTSPLCHQYPFADIAIGWNKEGIEIFLQSNSPFHQAKYPEVSRGDSLEVFFDTRDVKTSGYNTRFCHHFFFLPEAVDGCQAGEITHFRTEDTHDLCDPKELTVNTFCYDDGYTMQIFIPAQCLYGYDPEQFDRLGFSYRINRMHGKPQQFTALTNEYQFEQLPSLWSSLRLI